MGEALGDGGGDDPGGPAGAGRAAGEVGWEPLNVSPVLNPLPLGAISIRSRGPEPWAGAGGAGRQRPGRVGLRAEREGRPSRSPAILPAAASPGPPWPGEMPLAGAPGKAEREPLAEGEGRCQSPLFSF